MFESRMPRQKRSIAPITVFTNGNKYDATRFIYNPRYVRSFDALLDQLTIQTNATCAVRRIYTPHGRTQVGSLSAIEPGASYVAVSRGNFKKMSYGQTHIMAMSSSTGTATTKSRRQKLVSSRLQRSYEDQIKTQKNIYVHRNGLNELPKQIFFSKRVLRSMSQVLDMIQEKIGCERAIVSLHKLNGLTITDVGKLQPEGRYVAVEQGQRFKRISYDQVDDDATSPGKLKLPVIGKGGMTSFRSTMEGKPHSRHPSNESGQTTRGKAKLKLPVIKQAASVPQGFQVIYGYPKNEDKEVATHKSHGNTIPYQYTYHQSNDYYSNNHQRNSHYGNNGEARTRQGDHQQVNINDNSGPANHLYDNPYHSNNLHNNRHQDNNKLDFGLQRHIPKDDMTKPPGGIDHHGNSMYRNQDHKADKTERKEKQSDVKLPDIVHAPKPPTKPSIAHPKRHKHSKRLTKDNVPQGVVNDQRFASRDNDMATTKQYIVTREQRLLNMNEKDGRQPVANAVHVYAADTLSRDLRHKDHEIERRKRVDKWVDSTVDEKQREEEIVSVANQLVLTAIQNAGGYIGTGGINNVNKGQAKKDNVPSFYESEKSKGVKYHRVFGT